MSHPGVTIRPTRIVRPEGSGVDVAGGRSGTSAIILSRFAEDGRPGSVGPSILVDFGREVFGGVRTNIVSVASGGKARLRVRLGESASEAEDDDEDHRDFDRIEWARGGHQLESGISGFRFLRLDLLDLEDQVEMALPEAIAIVRDLPNLGSFDSDDDRLNRIWSVGVETVRLCMQDRIWDGIKRGRTVWAGDLHPALNVIAAAFGPHPVVTESLDWLLANSTRRPGPPEWMNEIPAYSLWWMICQAEWFLYTGDRTYLEARHNALVDLLAIVSEGVDAQGREQFEGWRYLDWATTRDPDAIHVGYQGLVAWALKATRSLARTLGDLAMIAQCGDILARVEAYRPPSTSNKQARALMALGGLADPMVTNRDVLAPNPSQGLTPFLGYHVLEARALAFDHAGALDLIRSYWGAMIDLGATTFWEDFRDSWVAGAAGIDQPVPKGLRDVHGTSSRGFGLSLCHAWSAGPSAWLSRHVLGVQPVEPGCRVIAIRPHLDGLSRAEGRFPTPLGVVKVRHRKKADGSIDSDVDAPDGIEIRLGG